ncbi:prepilin peptidase [Klebsiella aerogenes]|uniref:prepilin peptidase n=1 Tax=Klebsiella aerogenes TaxID=548 RepID=UPI0007B3F62F|nr:A24 family peptidase [Klebsiella aerogenes]EKZ5855731.1 prepilin peptidase [Klebsiella aerogenes]EKZ6548492.1 prepilin peptidase [Klebsiella aerogenes]EKZ6676769.1 prepilin peptidase [Klebsiella aerogenes]KZR11291.1 hypothetical protein A3N65_12405 [Klebsiella aerogenes]
MDKLFFLGVACCSWFYSFYYVYKQLDRQNIFWDLVHLSVVNFIGCFLLQRFMVLGFCYNVLIILLWNILIIDFYYMRIPKVLTWTVFLSGFFCLFINNRTELVNYMFSSSMWFLIFVLIYWLFDKTTGRAGLGFGDVRLIASLGMWISPSQMPMLLFLSSGLALVIILPMVIFINKPVRELRLPFGPFLVCGTFWLLYF